MPKITLQVFGVPKRRIKRCRGMAQPVRGSCLQAVHLISFTPISAQAVQGGAPAFTETALADLIG